MQIRSNSPHATPQIQYCWRAFLKRRDDWWRSILAAVTTGISSNNLLNIVSFDNIRPQTQEKWVTSSSLNQGVQIPEASDLSAISEWFYTVSVHLFLHNGLLWCKPFQDDWTSLSIAFSWFSMCHFTLFSCTWVVIHVQVYQRPLLCQLHNVTLFFTKIL